MEQMQYNLMFRWFERGFRRAAAAGGGGSSGLSPPVGAASGLGWKLFMDAHALTSVP